jgi:hypothetical protein
LENHDLFFQNWFQKFSCLIFLKTGAEEKQVTGAQAIWNKGLWPEQILPLGLGP